MKPKLATIRILKARAFLAGLAGLAIALPMTAHAASYYKANTTTLASGSTDWTPNGTPTTLDICSWQSGTGMSTLALANAMSQTLGGSLSCANFDLRGDGGTRTAIVITDSAPNAINLYSTLSGNNVCALDQGNGAVSTAINCPITLNANAYVRNAAGGDLTIGGSIGEAGGARSLSFNGSNGWVNLSGVNTYSGGTAITGTSGALLTVGGSGTLGVAGSALTLPTAGTSGVALELGGTTQTVGAVNLGQACVIQNGALNATNFNAGASAYGVFNVNLGGTGALTLNNSGKLSILTGTNSWSGATTVTAGTLLVTKPVALPNSGASGTITMNGAAGVLALRAGAASGEWTSSNLDNLLANSGLTFTAAGAALGIDTTGGDFSYGSVIPNKTNNALKKFGANKLTLSGANLYPGATLIVGGSVRVDAGSGGSLASTSGLTFLGTGAFNYDTSATSQNMGALNFSAGDGNVVLTRSSDRTLTFSSLAARTAGATGNLALSAGTPSATNGIILTGASAGFINQGTFFGGADFAYMDATGTFVRAPAYGTDSGFTAADTITAGTHVKLTSTPAAQAAITLNTLNLAGSGVGFPQTGSLALTNNGLLKSGGGAAGTVSGGSINVTNNTSATTKELVVRTDSANDSLTINSVVGTDVPSRTGTTVTTSGIVTGLSNTSDLTVGMTVVIGGNGTTRTISSINSTSQITLSGNSPVAGTPTLVFYSGTLTKTGAGSLTLNGANTLAGGVNLNAGRLNIGGITALGGGVPASGTAVGKLTLNEGTALDNTSGGPLTMSYKYAMAWNGSFTFVGTNDLGFVDPSGNGNISMPYDATVTVQTADKTLRLASNFTITTARLTKSGPGTLQVGSNGGFGVNGGLIVNEGVFASYWLAGGQPQQGFSGPVELGDTTAGNSRNAIIDIVQGNQYTSPITVRAGSSGTLALMSEASLTLNGPLVLNNNLTLSAPGSNTLSHYGVISGSGGLRIGNPLAFVVFGANKSLVNAGSVKLYNRNTYAGNTTVNSGTLALGALGKIDNSPVISLAAGTTLDVSAIATPYTLSSTNTLSAKGTGTTAGTTAAQIKGASGGTVNLGSQALNLTFAPTTANDTTHPSLYVSQGSLALNNNAFTVVTGSQLGAGTYRLIQVGNGTSGVITENVTPSYPVTVSGSGLAPNSLATVSVLSGNVIMTVVTRSVTSFSNLTLSETIQMGTSSVTLGGTISAAGPVYPADGETLSVTINGVTQTTTTSGGTFTLSFATGTLTGSGSPFTITYSYPGNATLTPATDASTTLTVTTQTVPTISAWPTATSITYGQTLASSTLSGGSASTAGTFTFSTLSATPTAGTYGASGTFTPSNPALFSTVVVPGAISVPVAQKELTLTSPAVTSRGYNGTSAATITGTLSGVLPADAGLVTLVGSGTFQAPAPAVGSGIAVDAACTLAGTKAPNYYLTQPSGLAGDITQGILTVRATNVGRPAGVANPSFTFTVSGYQNGDTASTVGLSGTPDLTSTADLASPEGSYAITCTVGSMSVSSPNYALAFADGVLQVLSTRTWAKGNGVWDIETSANWTSASLPATYVDGGEVLFPDPTGFGLGPFAVTLNTSVHPYSVTVNNPTKDYTLSGSGAIGGTAGVIKQGAGMLTLAAANTYSGGTSVNAGTLTVANQNALGSGIVTLAGGATLQQAVFEGNSAAGALPNALVLSGGFATTNLNFGLAKDLWLTQSVSGPGGLIVQSGDGIRSLTLAGAKTFEGGVTMKDGNRVQISNSASLGSGTLSLGNAAGGTLSPMSNLAGSPLPNTVDLTPGCTLKVDTTSGGLNLGGTIQDSGILTKTGSNPLVLSGSSTYTGSTKIVSGSIQVSADANLGACTLVGGGGVLDVGTNSFSLGRTMTGANVISVTAPGDLTVTGDLTAAALAKAGTGTLTTGAGVTVHLADFLDAGGTLNLTNPLAISSALYLGKVELALTGGTAFTLSGANVLAPSTNSPNTITASSGTVTLTPPAAAVTGGTIGSGTLGSASYNPATGVASVTASASGTPQTDDHVWEYTSMPTGDFDFKVHVVSGASGWQRAGLMIRDSLAKAGNYSAVWATGGATCAATGITGTTGNTSYREDLATATWMRIKKVGLTVTSLYSSDGVTYNEAYTRTYAAWGATTYVGVDLTYGAFTATFDNISFLGDGTMPDWSTTDLTLNTGALMNLNYAGTAIIAGLTFDGTSQALGTWGSSSSGATHPDDTRFAGTGTVTVTTVAVPVSDYATWAGASGYNLSGGPTGDDDGDGMSNFAEYAFGLNPKSASSVNPISQPLNKSTGLFKYTRRATPATSGLTYSYEWSATLSGDWQAFTPAVNPVSNLATPVEEVSVQVPAALLANPKLFLRVKAQQ